MTRNPFRLIAAVVLFALAIGMAWGWPGLLIFVGSAFSAITAYREPQDKVSQLLLWLAVPNLWCVGKGCDLLGH